MTNAFWTHFMNDGKRKLQEYNRKNGTSVRIIRDHTVNITDVENLSLYLRRRILKLFNDQDMTPPEMVVKNGYVTITGMPKLGTKRYRSTELSVLLGLDYNDWNGTAINKMLTVTERRNMEDAYRNIEDHYVNNHNHKFNNSFYQVHVNKHDRSSDIGAVKQ
ncbi:unnamed protein product [Heligmosomoides polygyrus]|uniref:Doublecortin domain-containing protein n=1 Tax=Heligmosomoides polygyrus TaxID=6339 RepID=A0A3P7ZR07_HELPZ|nr:unnamed protein product [Heligmosomoides polygyrus]